MPLLRAATVQDTPTIVSVIKEVYDEYGFPWYPEDYHADLYDLQAFYFDKGHPFWIAELNGEAVGTAALDLYPRLPGAVGETVVVEGRVRAAGSDCSLERLYVRPGARKAGVGYALFAQTILTARERGCHAMEIWSDIRFEAAHRLYMREGARLIGERLCHDPEQSPEFGLVLEL